MPRYPDSWVLGTKLTRGGGETGKQDGNSTTVQDKLLTGSNEFLIAKLITLATPIAEKFAHKRRH